MRALLAYPLIILGIVALLFAAVIEKFLLYIVIGFILYIDLLIYLFPLLDSLKKVCNVIGWIFVVILILANIFAGLCIFYSR